MKITRYIKNEPVEIQLTDSERTEAYFEQQAEFDLEDVLDVICGSEQYTMDCYGVTEEEFRSLAKKIAVEMRHYIDVYDMFWSDARDRAIECVVKDYLEEKENA